MQLLHILKLVKTIITDADITISTNIEALKSGDIIGLWTNKSTIIKIIILDLFDL